MLLIHNFQKLIRNKKNVKRGKNKEINDLLLDKAQL